MCSDLEAFLLKDIFCCDFTGFGIREETDPYIIFIQSLFRYFKGKATEKAYFKTERERERKQRTLLKEKR